MRIREMDQELQFPIKLTEGFPLTAGYLGSPHSPIPPFSPNAIYLVDECLFEDVLFPEYLEEAECECPEESVVSEEVEELYTKGFPFYKPLKIEVTPKLTYRKNFTSKDYCDFNKMDIMPKISGSSWHYKANEICFDLLCDAVEYSKERKFSNRQGLALMEMFYKMFQYFMVSPILLRKDFFKFFRELLLLYAVQDAPDSLRFFTPMECFGIAYKFSTLFDRNFDLLRAIVSPNFIIKINIEQ